MRRLVVDSGVYIDCLNARPRDFRVIETIGSFPLRLVSS
jgi:hypothetical protein